MYGYLRLGDASKDSGNESAFIFISQPKKREFKAQVRG